MSKIVFKIAAINTLKATAFKWKMTPWEERFVEDILLSESVYRGISEKQYSIFNDIAASNGVDLSASIQGANPEYEQYESIIGEFMKSDSGEKAIRLGTAYDFGKRMGC